MNKTETKLPDWMLSEDGKLAQMLPLGQMDRSRGQIHVITCTGIGDVAWVWAKLWKLAEEREVVWWFPDAGQYNRIQPYCKLTGMKYGGLVGIDTKTILSNPGEFNEEVLNDPAGGIYYVHANRHIEEGKPLHSRCPNQMHPERKNDERINIIKYDADVWHPWLPFRNPAPPLTIVHEGERPPQSSVNEGVWKYDKPRAPYVVVHAANQTYCEGNWFPRQWARIIEHIEKTVAPVCLIGAKWDETMIEDICKWYLPAHPACIGQSLGTALSVIANSTAMIGVDSGLSIMATYYGLPALRCYPRWLTCMPGTWEDTEVLHPHNKAIFMDELLDEFKPWLERL